MHKEFISEDIKNHWREVFENVKNDRERYFNWIKDEIETAINLINKHDKIHVMGGLAAKLIKSTQTPFSEFMADHGLQDTGQGGMGALERDDQIELLLEYAMSIAAASDNSNSGNLPSQQDIEEIYGQLSKLKQNMAIWEMSSEMADGNVSDQWLRTQITVDNIHVRGNGYQLHIIEVFKGLYGLHNDFIRQIHGFDAHDLLDVILKLDLLVLSKLGDAFGASLSHKRFTEWSDQKGEDEIYQEMERTGKHFMQQFTEDNPDLYSEQNPEGITTRSIDDISASNIIFWVIPQSGIEKLIFARLATGFGDNTMFFQPAKFKAFILNDTMIKSRSLIREGEKFYHFSLNLAFRNIFRIADELIKEGSEVYFQHQYQGNTNPDSKDNYVEGKTKALFEKLLPSTTFYRSLDYFVDDENGNPKKTELDILGISDDAAYIIEVKAGTLNDKHRRGAIKGLKDRLEQTVTAGSYQCQRALKYIEDNEAPEFSYVADRTRKSLVIDKSKIKSFYKITVTFEHLASIAANLKHLVGAGIFSEEYKWSWIVSLFDLMVFADLMPDENTFKDYLANRVALYDRDDIEFSDELDILGFFMDGNFPLEAEKADEHIRMLKYSDKIEEYYNSKTLGFGNISKPEFKKKA